MSRPVPYEPWRDRAPGDLWDKRVRCENCEHIARNPINPGAAAARCSITGESHYPMARHYCARFKESA